MDFAAYTNFLKKYAKEDPNSFAFKKPKDLQNLEQKFVLEQLNLNGKALQKLPTFVKEYCFFTSKSFEQSTAEAVAKYKAGLFFGDLLIDLSGGLGVDDWAFSKSFKKVISVDPDEYLNSIVRYNFTQLGANNIERINSTAESFLKNIPSDCTVYIDPDRRVDSGRRSFLLSDCLPDVSQIVPKLLELNCKVLIKLSPMFDISEAIVKLQNVESVLAIAHKNEMKELLVICSDKPIERAVLAVNIKSDSVDSYSAQFPSFVEDKDILGDETYFYEPNVALVKTGLWKAYSALLGLSLFETSTPYLAGKEAIPNFQGRSFKLLANLSKSPNKIAKILKEIGLEKANISARNYFEDVNAIRKRLKIADGGEFYLFFFKDKDKNGVCLLCERA